LSCIDAKKKIGEKVFERKVVHITDTNLAPSSKWKSSVKLNRYFFCELL